MSLPGRTAGVLLVAALLGAALPPTQPTSAEAPPPTNGSGESLLAKVAEEQTRRQLDSLDNDKRGARGSDGELLNRRTETSKTFVKPDGGFRTEIHTGQVHYQTDDAGFVDLEPTIHVAGSGAGKVYREAKQPVSIEVPPELGAGPASITDDRGSAVQLEVRGAGAGKISEDRPAEVTYAEDASARQVQLVATGHGLSYEIELRDMDDLDAITVEILLDEAMTATTLDTGRVVVSDAEDQPRFVVDPPTVSKKNGEAFSSDTDATLGATANGTSLTWELKNAPVAQHGHDKMGSPISGPIALTGAVQSVEVESYDCWISELSWYHCSLDHELRTGDFFGYPSHSLVWFDVDAALPDVAQLDAATVELTASQHTSNGPGEVGAYRLLRAWDPETVAWDQAATNNPWGLGGHFHGTPFTVVEDAGVGTDQFEVTDLANDWLTGAAANHGLLFRTQNPNSPSVRWHSSKENSQLGPKLVVDWSLPPDAVYVDPIFECAERDVDGTFNAYFGYENFSTDEFGEPVDANISIGQENSIVPASYESVLPESFIVPQVIDGRPGRTMPGATDVGGFMVDGWDGNTELTWQLLGNSVSADAGIICSDSDAKPSSHARIQEAFNAGELDLYSAIEAQLLAAVDSPELPTEFRRQASDVSVDFPVVWYLAAFEQLSNSEREQLADSLGFPHSTSQPNGQAEELESNAAVQSQWSDCLNVSTFILYIFFACEVQIQEGDTVTIDPGGSGSGPAEQQVSPADFTILFNVGADEVNPVDTKQPGRPDAIFDVIAETVNTMNYFIDRGFDPPNREFIVVVSSWVTDNQGFSLPSVDVNPLAPLGRVSALIGLNTSPSPGLIQHEVFHQIQYAYATANDIIDRPSIHWWMEATARWAEHQLQDRVGAPQTYARNLPDFLGSPQLQIDDGFNTLDLADNRKYGSFIVAEYLDAILPAGEPIRRTWEDIRDGEVPIDSIRDRMVVGGSSLEEFWISSFVLDHEPSLGLGFDLPQSELDAWREHLTTAGPPTLHSDQPGLLGLLHGGG